MILDPVHGRANNGHVSLWLIDLCDDLPESTTLDGFDISDEQYPHEAWLPPNVSLHARDIFESVPAELTCRYDLINIRFFTCVVRDNDPHRIVQHAFEMLSKLCFLIAVDSVYFFNASSAACPSFFPFFGSVLTQGLGPGGFLQWTEFDGLNESNVSAPGVSDESWELLKREVEAQTQSGPGRFRWLSRLATSLQQAGFIDIIQESREARKSTYSLWQQLTLMVAEEMSYSVPEGHKIRMLVQANQLDTPKGIYWNRPHLVFVAKKPLQETPNS